MTVVISGSVLVESGRVACLPAILDVKCFVDPVEPRVPTSQLG